VEMGGDWVMNEISAVLGHYQLKRLDEYLERRNEIADIYTRHVAGMDGIKAFHVPSGIRHSYYKYATLLSRELNAARVMKQLKEKHGIETGGIYNPACHMQPLYRKMFGFGEGHFPIADDVLRRVLCPPMYADLSNEEIDYVVGCLKEELDDNSNHSPG
jgi:perosamine synthetase